MKLKDGRITFLINQDFTEITLEDATSNLTFAKIRLTPGNLSNALSRLGFVKCDIELLQDERLDKKMENEEYTFEIPEGLEDKIKIHELAIKSCPEGWRPDNYYERQNTFSYKGKQKFVTVTIRRWV